MVPNLLEESMASAWKWEQLENSMIEKCLFFEFLIVCKIAGK
jgi:hypothetical protein